MKPIQPPTSAQRILLLFLRDDLVEEVLGDLNERFYTDVKTKTRLRARLNYWYQVIQYMRPFAIRKSRSSINHYDMFENYFKIGWRNLVKQKMYSAIKIGGFAIGIAACLLIALFIRDELSYDVNYPDGDRIYRVVEAYHYRGQSGRDVWFQAPFAKALKEDFPEIEKVGRYNSSELFGAGSKQVRRSDNLENTYEEGFIYFDQELFDIFKFPMIYGNPAHALDQPHSIVITKRKADKYFPNENPVGKTLIVNDDDKQPFVVGGVIEDIPANSHLQFDFLMTLTGVEFWPGEQSTWDATNYPTYVQLRPGTDPAQFQKKLSLIIEQYMYPHWVESGTADAKTLAKSIWFELQPVRDIHLRSAGIEDPVSHGDIRFVWLFAAIAFFILLIAIINFVNLATARSANRAKEVGLRKTVGSHRNNIINQFLTESILYSAISFAIGISLAYLLLPYFNTLANKSIQFPWSNWQLYPVIIVAVLIIGLVAGIYPSFYLSSFKPAGVLKGNVSRGSKGSTLRSSLVVFQFTASIILIIATMVIYRQVQYILTKNAGFDKDQVVIIQGTGTINKSIKSFKSELRQLSSVKNATISDYLPIKGTKRNGNSFWNEGRNKIDQSVGFQVWITDPDYMKTLGMKLLEGRNFSENIASDSAGIIINQTAAKELGLKDPVGKRIQNWQPYTILGVVEDFHYETMREKIKPLAFVLGLSPGMVSVKISGRDVPGTLRSIEDVWKKFAPNQPIRYSFMDDSFARMYDDIQRMNHIFTTFAVLAIIVACLGLFALSAFMVEQRSKEISIRLVLGASLNNVFNLLTLNFLKLVVIAIVLATPIAWYFMQKWLEDFTYKTSITWDIFFMAGVAAIVIALATVSYQALRAALLNPVENLKMD